MKLGPDAFGFEPSCSEYVSYSLAWATLNTSTVPAANIDSAVFFNDSTDRFFYVYTTDNTHESYGSVKGWVYDLVLTATH